MWRGQEGVWRGYSTWARGMAGQWAGRWLGLRQREKKRLCWTLGEGGLAGETALCWERGMEAGLGDGRAGRGMRRRHRGWRQACSELQPGGRAEDRLHFANPSGQRTSTCWCPRTFGTSLVVCDRTLTMSRHSHESCSTPGDFPSTTTHTNTHAYIHACAHRHATNK